MTFNADYASSLVTQMAHWVMVCITLMVVHFNLRINIQLAKDGFLDKDKVVKEYNDTIDLKKVTKEKDAIIHQKDLIIEELNKKYEDLNSDIWDSARTWEETTIKFNAVVKERDEVIKIIKQRNLYLEHIVKEMVLEPK